MTPEQAAAAAKPAVLALGSAFSDDPKTMRRARQIGLTGWAFYVAGRGGALGNVRADTVAAALGFIAPEAVQDGWEAACKVAPPEEIAAQCRAECCRWGHEHLDGFYGLARLVELAERKAAMERARAMKAARRELLAASLQLVNAQAVRERAARALAAAEAAMAEAEQRAEQAKAEMEKFSSDGG